MLLDSNILIYSTLPEYEFLHDFILENPFCICRSSTNFETSY
jgi:hypothetical protein